MHEPVFREYANSDTAVVFIHGMMGSPTQFTDLADAVYAQGCTYLSVLLPGHGVDAAAFTKFGLCDWETHLQGELNQLNGKYKKIYLAGHSMGGLLALNASLRKENHIAGILLISTPLRVYLLNLKSLLRKLRLLTWPKTHPIKSVYLGANSIAKPKQWFCPPPIRPLAGLYRLMRKTKQHLPYVTVPVRMFFSQKDETTSYKSAVLLYDELCNTQRDLFSLSHSWHAYYDEAERKHIVEQLLELVGA